MADSRLAMLDEYAAGTAVNHDGWLAAVNALSTAAETSTVMLPAELATLASTDCTDAGR